MLRNSLATVIAAATLTFGGLANAAFYNSSFDPPGPLSFMGTGLFQIDDSCLLAADGIYGAAACHLTLLGATVDMIDTVSNDTAHLNFASVLGLGDMIDMINFKLVGGELVGVNSDPIGWVFGSPATGTLDGIPWWIQWGFSNNDPVFLYTGSCRGDQCFRETKSAGTAEHVTFTRVPEPGTLVLLLGALTIGGLMRRRANA